MRDVNSLKGLHGVRTMQSAKKRSIPRIQSSSYLDLYMLKKEKERLLKEDERVDMKKESIKKRLEDIDLEMNKLQEAEAAVKAIVNTSSSGGVFTEEDGGQKEWKKISLSY